MQKIIATIGPISSNKSALLKLKKAGMDIVRLNGSHSNLEWHKKIIILVREVLPTTPIIFDIPGRKIRLGQLSQETKFAKNEIAKTKSAKTKSATTASADNKFAKYICTRKNKNWLATAIIGKTKQYRKIYFTINKTRNK